MIDDLIDTVISLSFSRGVENSLINKLEAAFDSVLDGNDSSVITNLNDFITTVEKNRGKKIPTIDADELTALAQDILAFFVTQTTGTVIGTVTDSSTSNPIQGASVSADSGQGDTTDADGNYTLTNVPTGTRTVTASATDFVTKQVTNVVVSDGQTTSGIDFGLVSEPVGGGTGTVKGTVRNAGAKVGGILVTTNPPSNSDTTNKGGKYNVGDVPTGTVSMIADCPSGDQTVPVMVNAGATVTVDFDTCV